MMEQSAIITYFDNEIIAKEQEKYACACHLISCKDDIQRVISDINNLNRIDLERVQNALALDEEMVEKLRFYALLLKTSYYHLTDTQEQEIMEFFTKSLCKIKEDIEEVVESHPETNRINEIIDILKECRSKLIDEDFNLDDYTIIFIKLRPYNKECYRLCLLLANYMNKQLLEQNHISRLGR